MDKTAKPHNKPHNKRPIASQQKGPMYGPEAIPRISFEPTKPNKVLSRPKYYQARSATLPYFIIPLPLKTAATEYRLLKREDRDEDDP